MTDSMTTAGASFKSTLVNALTLLLAACAGGPVQGTKDGLVEYVGAQSNMFATGKAEPMVSVEAMSAGADSFGVGARAGLDGEITVFEGRPYVTQVRGEGYTVDHARSHEAAFAVWTRQSRWREEPVPAQIRTYTELQRFIKARAAAAGIDVAKPFPFLLAGAPSEVHWHINVDRTEGKPITRDLFAKSKASYVARNEPMDIVGFYSERHAGVFISEYAPAIKPGSGEKNFIHMHLVTRDARSAGHIDGLTLAPGMRLRLPQV